MTWMKPCHSYTDPALLATLQSIAKASVQGLKLFFITACDEGKLQRKRAKVRFHKTKLELSFLP
jgi:hypothetical protein